MIVPFLLGLSIGIVGLHMFYVMMIGTYIEEIKVIFEKGFESLEKNPLLGFGQFMKPLNNSLNKRDSNINLEK
jgi:hypothetical protein